MESTSVDKLAKQGHAVAAKASDMVTDLKDGAPIFRKAARQAQAVGKRGSSALGDITSQARDAATDATDSIIAYTKKNPVIALALAAIAGALLFTVAKANARRSD
jgi:hypothetical protein